MEELKFLRTGHLKGFEELKVSYLAKERGLPNHQEGKLMDGKKPISTNAKG